jgi:hypothetical protein
MEYDQYNSSVYIISFALLALPYSTGVKDMIKLVPSLPRGSRSPDYNII